jgi:hypothetical protein
VPPQLLKSVSPMVGTRPSPCSTHNSSSVRRCTRDGGWCVMCWWSPHPGRTLRCNILYIAPTFGRSWKKRKRKRGDPSGRQQSRNVGTSNEFAAFGYQAHTILSNMVTCSRRRRRRRRRHGFACLTACLPAAIRFRHNIGVRRMDA